MNKSDCCKVKRKQSRNVSNNRTEKRICVRLNSDNSEKLNAAIQKGYSISDFINTLISGSDVINISDSRNLMKHICHMETLVEGMEDIEIKNELRKELWETCQFLK